MAIDAEGVQVSLCSILKTKHRDSLPDARVELDSAMMWEALDGFVAMRASLGSERIWTHALGGADRRDVKDAGVDGEWRPDVTSGWRCVPSKG